LAKRKFSRHIIISHHLPVVNLILWLCYGLGGWPYRPKILGLVVTNKMALMKPLSPKIDSVAKVAAEGTWLGTRQFIHRTTVIGRTRIK